MALQGEAPVAVEMFVPDVQRQARSLLFDDVAAVLEEERDFVPVAFGARSALVNRGAIAYVAITRHAAKTFDDEISDVHALYDHRCPVSLVLVGGTSLRGTLLFTTPVERSRLIDFMNLGPRFVRLWTSDELYLVQRSAIRTLAESFESREA